MIRVLIFKLLMLSSVVSIAQLVDQWDVYYRECINCENTKVNSSYDIDYQYGNITPFTSWDITSDFGRRMSSSTTWHQGIDYSRPTSDGSDGDYGDMLLAIEDARVIAIYADLDLKRIVFEGEHVFGFAHIFQSGTNFDEMKTGDFILKKMNFPNEEFYAIIYLDDASEYHAISEVIGGTVTVGTTIIPATNYVSSLQPVAPLGGSGRGSGYAAHLHLHRFNDPGNNEVDYTNGSHNINPLQAVYHEEPDYDVELSMAKTGYGVDNSSILVQPRMHGESAGIRYYNSVLNIDQVDVKIRHEYDSESRNLFGKTFRSRISLGGRFLTRRYPAYNYPYGLDRSLDVMRAVGSTSVTGIAPRAYSDNEPNDAWDDYYFSDIIFRVHKDYRTKVNPDVNDAGFLSLRNQDAKYPDGNYYLSAEVTSVNGNTYWSDEEIDLKVDNYRPFIERVIVRADDEDGDILYDGFYNWNGSSYDSDVVALFADDNGASLWIQVLASEPLEDLTMNIDGTFYTQKQTNGERNIWIFNFEPLSPETIGTPVTMSLNGTDIHGSELDTDPSTMSYRTGTDDWSSGHDPGTENSFVLNDGELICELGTERLATIENNFCTYATILASNDNPQLGEAVIFNAIVGNYDILRWDFGHDAVADNTDKEETTVVFTEEGEVTISLYINSELVAEKTIYVGSVNKGPMITGLSANGLGTNSGIIGDEFILQANVLGDVQSYQWDFGYDANYADASSSSPRVSYFYPGNKNVRLTVYDSEGRSATFTRNSMIRITDYPKLETKIISGCSPVSASGFTYFDHETTGGELSRNNRTYFWDFGDGNTSISERPHNEYKKPGYYSVSLTVCDNSGCATDRMENCIYVEENGNNTDGNWEVDIYADGNIVPEEVTIDDETLCPEIANMPVFGVGVPVNFTVDVQRGGNGKDEEYSYSWFFDRPSSCVIPQPGMSASPKTALSGPQDYLETGPRNHIVVFNAPGIYPVTVTVGSDKPFGGSTSVTVSVNIQEGLGGERCRAGFGNFSLSRTCWDTETPPVINFDITYNNCPVENVDLYTVDEQGHESLAISNFESGDELSFDWNGADPTRKTIFNLVANIGAYQSGKLLFEWEPPLFEKLLIESDFSICKGASTSIGVPPSAGKSYEWTGEVGHEAYLSNTAVSNPVFTGIVEGENNYNLRITDLETGCHSDHKVTVVVGDIVSEDLTYETKAGANTFTLSAPFQGDGRSYEISWTPEEYLSNPKVANPIFTPPITGKQVNYSVEATFRDCTAASTVEIEVRNDPPGDLKVISTGKGSISIKWVDNSVESHFVIWRKELFDVDYIKIDEVPSNVSSYTDISCLNSETEYCYKVEAINLEGNPIGFSNSTCGQPDYALYFDWQKLYKGIYGFSGVNGTVYGQLYNRDGNVVLAAVTDYTGNTLTCDQDLTIQEISIEDGSVLKAKFTPEEPGCGELPGVRDMDVWARLRGSVMTNHEELILINSPYNGFGFDFFIEQTEDIIQMPDLQEVNINVFRLADDYKFIRQLNDDNWVITTTSKIAEHGDGINKRIDCIGAVKLTKTGTHQYTLSDEYLIHHDLWRRELQDVLVLPNNRIAFLSLADQNHIGKTFDWGSRQQTDLQIDITDYDFNLINRKRIAPGLDMSGGRLVLMDDGELLVAATAYLGLKENREFEASYIWYAKVSVNDLEIYWSERGSWNNSEKTIKEVNKRPNGRYILFSTTSGSNNIEFRVIDEDGNFQSEETLYHRDPSNIFDVHYDDTGNVYLASDYFRIPGQVNSNYDGVRIEKFAIETTLGEEYVELCDVISGESSRGHIAEDVYIGDVCDMTTFEAGSSTNLVVTYSGYIYSGTTIERGAYFNMSAVKEEDVIAGCLSIGNGRVLFSDNKSQFYSQVNHSNNLISVYPNPTSDWFIIRLNPEKEQTFFIQFIDLQGNEIWSVEKYTSHFEEVFSTNGLSSGMYVLNLRSDLGYVRSYRVLIKK